MVSRSRSKQVRRKKTTHKKKSNSRSSSRSSSKSSHSRLSSSGGSSNNSGTFAQLFGGASRRRKSKRSTRRRSTRKRSTRRSGSRARRGLSNSYEWKSALALSPFGKMNNPLGIPGYVPGMGMFGMNQRARLPGLPALFHNSLSVSPVKSESLTKDLNDDPNIKKMTEDAYPA